MHYVAAVALILVPTVEISSHSEIVSITSKKGSDVVHPYSEIVSVKGERTSAKDKYHLPLSLNSLSKSYFSRIDLIL